MPQKLRFNWIIRKYFGVLKYYWEIEIILKLKILTTKTFIYRKVDYFKGDKMGDIYCKKCGEPWDFAGVLMSLKGEDGDMSKQEAERFMAGEGCPCCGFGKYCPGCKGTGECGYCHGTGTEKVWNSWSEKWDYIMCRECGGTGICQRCGGDGKLKESHEQEYYDGLIDVDGEVDVLDYL